MKAIKLGMIAGLVALGASAMAADVDSVPVNLTVSPYIFASFTANAGDISAFTPAYGADPANNAKKAYNLTVDGNGGSAFDTLNIAWAENGPSQIAFGLDLGSGSTKLPGHWTMEFDGAGVTPPDQLFVTSNPADNNKKILVPVKLMVDGIGVETMRGNYNGTLKITLATNP